MANQKAAWYDTTEKVIKKDRSVQCDNFACLLSVKELSALRITCPHPIVKFSYWVKDRAGTPLLQGSHTFDGEGVTEFMLSEAISLQDLAPYETESADYLLDSGVTFPNGEEVIGFRVFKCNLRKGDTTKDLPRYDLLEKLNAIPIAKPGMTEEELRKICLDYMNLQCEFPFKFKEDYHYTVVSQNRNRRLLAGTVYGGIPYVTRGAGNLYRIAEFFDPETGTIDPSGDIFENIRVFGNACSGATCMAWGRAITSAYLGYSRMMTQANGFLPVGPYRYSDPEIAAFRKKKIYPDNHYDCNDICQENGEQTMFESYAMMKPADGVGCCGHVRMNSATPVMVRNEDGTINGDESYTLMTEQVCFVSDPNHIRIAEDGTHYTAQGLVDRKYTFRELFDTHYIPFTFAEFNDPSLVQKAKVLMSSDGSISYAVISSNYTIADVFCTAGGKKYAFRNEDFFCKEVKLANVFPEEALVDGAKISVRLYNGETFELDTRF